MAITEDRPCKKCKCTLYYSNNNELRCMDCASKSSDAQSKRAQALRFKEKMPKIAYSWGFGWQLGEINPFNYKKEIQLYCAWQAGFNDAGHNN